jgi:DHA1 family tetracycline resistance protein-like MFS transporter
VAFALPLIDIASFNNRVTGEFVLTLPLLVLFFARAADGLTGGNVSVANAYLADITTDADRSKNYGQMAVSTNLGFIVGPALAGLLGATVLGEILPVMSAFAISAVALALIQFGLVDTKPVAITEHLEAPNACAIYGQENKRGYQVESEKHDGLADILRLPNMPALMAVNFLVMMGFSVFYVAFPIHAVQALSWTVMNIGVFFAVVSLVMVVVQGPVLAWASARYSDRALMVFGGIVLGLAFVALLSARLEIIYVGGVLIAVGNGLMWPTFMSALSKSAGTRMQGAVQGFAGGAGAVASILGLVGGGIAYVSIGASIFMVGAVVILAAAAVVAMYRVPKDKVAA